MNIGQFLFGRSLKSSEAENEKMSVWKALPILSSDALSSVAYATEQILIVLATVGAIAAYSFSLPIALAIIALIGILIISYRQVIDAYPQGGGAYMVAKENIGMFWGRLAGVSLLMDYVLTVAVSVSAGVQAITSAFPATISYVVPITLILTWLMVWMNLRGTSESGTIFSIPTYLFIICTLLLIGKGAFDILSGHINVNHEIPILPTSIPTGLTLFVLLKAFSSGCSAVTGIEAISNAVPMIKNPSQKNAKLTQLLLGVMLAVIFGGITIIALFYGITPDPTGHTSVLSMISENAFGRGIFYYILQIATMLILTLAANTSFNGFPILASIMSKDKNFPRMFSQRGDRLAYNYGIITLGVLASILLITFQGKTEALIPLYAIGVFTSFTLAQGGLVKRWIVSKPKDWLYKVSINGLGTIVSLIVLTIFSVTKFIEGAWVIVVLIPLCVYGITKIYRHYGKIANQLRIDLDKPLNLKENIIIIPVSGIHKVVAESISYAKTLSSNIICFYVAESEEEIDYFEEKWKRWNPGVRLEVFHSRKRRIITPLIQFIERIDKKFNNNNIVTVILPEFIPGNYWEKFLHNQHAKRIRNKLMNRKDVVITTVPYHLK